MSKIINKPIGIRCADIYLRFPEIMEDECNDLAEFLEDEHIVYEGATDIFIDQKNKLDKQKEVLDKIKEILNKMIYEGYAPSSTGSITLYTATGENSEFGTRAKVILKLLEEIE